MQHSPMSSVDQAVWPAPSAWPVETVIKRCRAFVLLCKEGPNVRQALALVRLAEAAELSDARRCLDAVFGDRFSSSFPKPIDANTKGPLAPMPSPSSHLQAFLRELDDDVMTAKVRNPIDTARAASRTGFRSSAISTHASSVSASGASAAARVCGSDVGGIGRRTRADGSARAQCPGHILLNACSGHRMGCHTPRGEASQQEQTPQRR